MSQPIVQPYLFFNGNCRAAVEFYVKAIDAKVNMIVPFSESPTPVPPGSEDNIMHASFNIGESTIMASDGCEEDAAPGGFSLSISVKTKEEVDRYFHALAEGGKVTMAPSETFWSPWFGMLEDQFGISWMVGVSA